MFLSPLFDQSQLCPYETPGKFYYFRTPLTYAVTALCKSLCSRCIFLTYMYERGSLTNLSDPDLKYVKPGFIICLHVHKLI